MKIRARLDDEGTIHFEEVITIFTTYFWKKLFLEFARAGIGATVAGLLAALTPLLTNGDVKTTGVAIAALIGTAVASGLRALQAAFSNLETDSVNK